VRVKTVVEVNKQERNCIADNMKVDKPASKENCQKFIEDTFKERIRDLKCLLKEIE
jgi:hypothetical protein